MKRGARSNRLRPGLPAAGPFANRGARLPLKDLTWTCHVCGEERPDSEIGVYKLHDPIMPGVQITFNVRHCRDREACREGAVEVAQRWRAAAARGAT